MCNETGRTNWARPWSRAYWFALEMTQAGVSETPRYSTAVVSPAESSTEV